MPLPQPQGRQADVLYLPAKGHTVVLGTAGSGKTTIAIWRAAYLANAELPHAGRTLLVTFNTALVTYLQHLAGGELHDVTVEHYHRFARGYLQSQGMMGFNQICDPDPRRGFIRGAIAKVSDENGDAAVLDRSIRWFEEEFKWLAAQGIKDIDEYVDAERVGRTNVLARRLRPTVFKVYDEYRRLRGDSGYSYDWDDLASAVVDCLRLDTRPRRYKHIVIDEGQDFGPEMLRSLTAAVDATGSVTFFGDYAQQVYGSRMSWRSAGFNIQKVEEFKDNYRNSRPIARLALAISEMPYFVDVPDLVEPKDPTADGPKPTLVSFGDPQGELEFVVAQATRMAQTSSVALLFRDRSDEKRMSPYLGKDAVRLHRRLDSWTPGPALFFGTIHAAKGMEFQSVFLPFVSADRLPDPREAEALGSDEATARDGRLLYVGVTRAKGRLVLTHTGEPSKLLPQGDNLYTRLSR